VVDHLLHVIDVAGDEVPALGSLRHRIADDERSITGYLFEPVAEVVHAAVDYGRGVPGEWARGAPVGPRRWWLPRVADRAWIPRTSDHRPRW